MMSWSEHPPDVKELDLNGTLTHNSQSCSDQCIWVVLALKPFCDVTSAES